LDHAAQLGGGAMNISVKGWCPGALKPMPSGDGLLVRIRPWCSAFSLDQAAGLAEIAARLGNGQMDLTRRANLQIRGLAEESLADLQEALGQLDLLDPDPVAEAARNLMVGPLAGARTRALAMSLTDAIAVDRRVAALPAKFGWLVDDAAAPTIVDQRASVALCVMEDGVAVRREETWLGLAAPHFAVAAALAVAFGDMPQLSPVTDLPLAVSRPPGLTPPFGRLDAAQLKGLVALAANAKSKEIRLSPWRALYCDVSPKMAPKLGFISECDDPLLRIDACPGSPACASSTVDTRGMALKLAARGFEGTVHVSGCVKGCARSAPADLVLVGDDTGRFGVIHHGTPRDRVLHILSAGELP
jgi:precorrin-3B synthase